MRVNAMSSTGRHADQISPLTPCPYYDHFPLFTPLLPRYSQTQHPLPAAAMV